MDLQLSDDQEDSTIAVKFWNDDIPDADILPEVGQKLAIVAAVTDTYKGTKELKAIADTTLQVNFLNFILFK